MRKPIGLAGDLALEPLTDDPSRFRAGLEVLVAGRRHTVEAVNGDHSGMRLRLSGISDVRAAEKLRNQYLEVDASEVAELPSGSYYHWQLMGLRVVESSRGELGEVADILELPANDVYVVRGNGTETLVPALAAFVREINLETATMSVALPEEEVVQ